jgi:hypothetical protein
MKTKNGMPSCKQNEQLTALHAIRIFFSVINQVVKKQTVLDRIIKKYGLCSIRYHRSSPSKLRMVKRFQNVNFLIKAWNHDL